MSGVEFVEFNQLCGNNLRKIKEESDYKSMCGVRNFFKGHSFPTQNKKAKNKLDVPSRNTKIQTESNLCIHINLFILCGIYHNTSVPDKTHTFHCTCNYNFDTFLNKVESLERKEAIICRKLYKM